jgi:ribosomal protein L40E
MSIVCPFCEKSNPPDAKFCSACGGALHLAPCPNCGAVNDVSAASCFQCGTQLAGREAEPAQTEPAAVPGAAARRNRQPAWIAAAVAMLVGIGTLGYYALATRTEVAAPAVPTVVERTRDEVRPGRNDERAITSVPPERPTSASPAPVPFTAVPAPARAERKAVESIRPQAPKAPARERQGSAAVACTAQALALGLCREADGAPVPVAPVAVPRGDEGCTEVAAALGLCEPAAAQRGN